MIAFSEHVTVAAVGLIGVVITAAVTLYGIVLAHRKTNERIEEVRTENADLLDTGNGHSIGVAVARLEEMGWRLEHRIDALDAEVREQRTLAEQHLAEVTPLIGFVQAMHDAQEEES